MMQYRLNGTIKETDLNQLTISDMLQKELETIPSGIAIAVGQQVIPQSEWGEHLISEGQEILIITAVQGG